MAGMFPWSWSLVFVKDKIVVLVLGCMGLGGPWSWPWLIWGLMPLLKSLVNGNRFFPEDC